MELWDIRVEAFLQGELPGPSSLGDRTTVIFDLQKKLREEEELKARLNERKQELKSLESRTDELLKERERLLNVQEDLKLKLKVDVNRAAEMAKREVKDRLQMETEMKTLKEEYAELMKMKQEQQRQLQRCSVYQDFMERVVKMTKFEDVQRLTGHLESLLHIKEKLYKRESDAQEQADQLRKALLTLEDQHRLLRMHKNTQLSHLQTELENTRFEALAWERRWNHIQETAAKKTLQLGQIKMATLNLYEMTGYNVTGEEAVDLNDTEKQLDKVKMFIKDHDDLVKQYQAPSHRHSDGKRQAKKHKKPVKAHSVKH